MNILTNLFRKRGSPRPVSILDTEFRSFTGSPYGSAAFRSAVDAIAKHCGKLQAHCDGSKRLEKLLAGRPNAYMGSYTMLYKLATALYTHGNGFLLLDRDDSGHVVSVYPMAPTSAEFLPPAGDQLPIKFSFPDGNELIFPYSDVVHLRRHFLSNDLLADSNGPLYPTLDASEAITKGMVKSIQNGTSIRAVIQYEGIMSDENIKEQKEKFVRDYMGVDNAGGVAALDRKAVFIPANLAPYRIDRGQVDAVNKLIYDYLGIAPEIVNGSFTEDGFSSFYESTIEPFALQLSQELTEKTGIPVTFSAERMEFSSSRTKISLLHEAAPLGIVMVNEARHLLALPPVEDGEERLMSLNYIKTKDAEEYQLGTREGEEDGKEKQND